MVKTSEEVQLSKSVIRSAVKDNEHSAEAVNLVYVNDSQLTIERVSKGKSFQYKENKKIIKEKDKLERIRKLVLPPAWKNVRISKFANGHLQAIGYDVSGRKQYKYHTLWSTVRNHTKFYRLLEFGKQMPSIRKRLEKDLSLPGLPKEKILAAIVTLLEFTNIRVGNSSYEKLYGSFGLTTLKNKHVALNGSKLIFSFKGKKGIEHRITLKSKRLAKIVKSCREIPGKELFEYKDDSGNIHNIDSGMVNEYIREISGGDFTAKDFRTWSGSVNALSAFKEAGDFESESQMKEKIKQAFEIVSKELGNTVAVCRKYYVHPVITKLYEEKKLMNYISNLEVTDDIDESLTTLAPDEKILMKILSEN